MTGGKIKSNRVICLQDYLHMRWHREAMDTLRRKVMSDTNDQM